MNNDFDKNTIIFKKLLIFNCSMGNENVLVIFVAGIITPNVHHFRYVTLLEKQTKQEN